MEILIALFNLSVITYWLIKWYCNPKRQLVVNFTKIIPSLTMIFILVFTWNQEYKMALFGIVSYLCIKER